MAKELEVFIPPVQVVGQAALVQQTSQRQVGRLVYGSCKAVSSSNQSNGMVFLNGRQLPKMEKKNGKNGCFDQFSSPSTFVHSLVQMSNRLESHTMGTRQ